MGDVFGKPAIVTDTHCIRLCNRIGLVKDEKEPKKVEMALWKIVPPEEGSGLCHRFVDHGREVCTARTTPHCERCCLNAVSYTHLTSYCQKHAGTGWNYKCCFKECRMDNKITAILYKCDLGKNHSNRGKSVDRYSIYYSAGYRYITEYTYGVV